MNSSHFLQMETVFAKEEFSVFIIYQSTNSGNAILKNPLANAPSRLGQKLESKSPGAFNFIGIFPPNILN